MAEDLSFVTHEAGLVSPVLEVEEELSDPFNFL